MFYTMIFRIMRFVLGKLGGAGEEEEHLLDLFLIKIQIRSFIFLYWPFQQTKAVFLT